MSIAKSKKSNIGWILHKSSLPRLDAEVLLAYVLKKDREFLLTHPELAISEANHRKFRVLAAKRNKNWPIAYLTGHKEFYGLDFLVNPQVLVPRPETELMVEEVIRLATQAPDNLANPVTVIDIGTGSGAIIISTASELRRLYPRLFSRADFLAVEISRSALAVAKINARRQELAKQIKFYHGDLLTPLKLSKNSIASQRLIITANLPYLTPSQIKHSPSICREPRLALAAGSDGLKYYRQLFKQLTQLKLNNIACHLLLEIDPGQKKSIKSLAKQYWPAASVKIKNDLSGRARLVILTIEV